MSYSLDLRQKVIDYVESGGKIAKAAKLFGIGRASIYRWLDREYLEATKVKNRQRKLDRKELESKHSAVSIQRSAIYFSLRKKLGFVEVN